MARTFTPEQRRKFADLTGVDEQYLYQCLTGRRDMNPARAREVEEELSKHFPEDQRPTRRDLCQKTWVAIWPELDRRKATR